MTGNGEKCFKCGKATMPRLEKNDPATARACQDPDCRAIEYLDQAATAAEVEA